MLRSESAAASLNQIKSEYVEAAERYERRRRRESGERAESIEHEHSEILTKEETSDMREYERAKMTHLQLPTPTPSSAQLLGYKAETHPGQVFLHTAVD